MRDKEFIMRSTRQCDRRGLGPRLWFGFVLLSLGILWTLDNLRFLDAGEILDWWPVVLVALGVGKLAGWGGRVRPIAGLLWIVIGGFLLAHNLRVIPWGLEAVWPIGLVLLGAILVWKSVRGRDPGSTGGRGAVTVLGGDTTTGMGHASAGVVDTATFSAVAVWAGVTRKSTSQAFRGGDFTALMGGGDIDLRNAKPIPGGCVIELALVMGGVDIKVPENWTVVNEVFAFMGGVEDSRKSAAVDGPDVLVLRGFAVMGGVEIKN